MATTRRNGHLVPGAGDLVGHIPGSRQGQATPPGRPVATTLGRDIDAFLAALSDALNAKHVRLEVRLDTPGSPRYRVNVNGQWGGWNASLRAACAEWSGGP